MGGRRRRHGRSPEEMDRARGRASERAILPLLPLHSLTPLQCGAGLRVAAPVCGGQPRNLSQNHVTSKSASISSSSFSPLHPLSRRRAPWYSDDVFQSAIEAAALASTPIPPELNEVALFLSCTRSRLFASKC